jgi:hypothetical protein
MERLVGMRGDDGQPLSRKALQVEKARRGVWDLT